MISALEKKKQGRRLGNVGRLHFIVNREVKESITKMMTFEEHFERSKGASHVKVRGKRAAYCFLEILMIPMTPDLVHPKKVPMAPPQLIAYKEKGCRGTCLCCFLRI